MSNYFYTISLNIFITYIFCPGDQRAQRRKKNHPKSHRVPALIPHSSQGKMLYNLLLWYYFDIKLIPHSSQGVQDINIWDCWHFLNLQSKIQFIKKSIWHSLQSEKKYSTNTDTTQKIKSTQNWNGEVTRKCLFRLSDLTPVESGRSEKLGELTGRTQLGELAHKMPDW